MHKNLLFISLALIVAGCNSSTESYSNLDGRALVEQKCSSCHNLDMPPATSDKEKAPPLFTVTVHLKDWIKVNNPSELKGKFVDFVSDYVLNPSKEKSYCDKKSLETYGLMPSQKGKVTKDEAKAIASYIFDLYDQKKILELNKERARIARLPLYQQVLETNDCRLCHQKNSSKNAPTFEEIGKKYGVEGKEIIKNSILNGSKGKWKGHLLPMKAYKNIPQKQLDALVDWIANGAKER